jgi:outer membrane protein TolC
MNVMRTRFAGTASILAASLLAGCAVGPRYSTPEVAVPSAYKEHGLAGADLLQAAEPRDHVSRQGWWDVFGDAQLNELEAWLLRNNPTITEAEARLRQARAVLRQDRAAYFPVITDTTSATRTHPGASSRVGVTSGT